MAEKKIIICHFGGSFISADDGSLQYKGGDAKAFGARSSFTVNAMKSELAEEMKCQYNALKLKYFLPGDTQTPLSISIDKDFQRMIEFYGDAKTLKVYALKENVSEQDEDGHFMIDSRREKATVEESTSFAGPCSPSPNSPRREKDVHSTPGTEIGKFLSRNSWHKAITGVGQEFKSVKEFRSALAKFAIAGGFHFKFVKNDPKRVSVKCKDDLCMWRVHASKSKTSVFRIKKYEGPHTCRGETDERRYPTAKYWLEDVIKGKLMDSPLCKPREIISELQQEYGVNLKYLKAYRAMGIARKSLEGSSVHEYSNLPQFCQTLTEANPGSRVMLITNDEARFKGLFMCLYASQFGFNEGCRPLVFLSGTTFKDKEQEAILSATSVDANDNMFPVAVSIVDTEDEANWEWFLKELKQVLQPDRRVTFISKRSEELVKVVPAVFGHSCHAYCVRDICERSKHEVKGGFSVEVKDYMIRYIWKAANAVSEIDFDREINEIRNVSESAAEWVIQTQPDHWSNAFFQGERYSYLAVDTTNLLDEWIQSVQGLTILKKIHQIISKMVENFNIHRRDAQNCKTRLSSSAEKRLQTNITESAAKQVRCSSDSQYEVWDGKSWIVDLNAQTCTCKQWQINGWLCSHAIAVLNQVNRSPYDFFSPFLTTDLYQLTYSSPMNPIPDELLSCTDGESTPVHPPLLKRKPGRPKTKGKELLVERRSLHCSKCGGTRHNKLTCKQSD